MRSKRQGWRSLYPYALLSVSPNVREGSPLFFERFQGLILYMTSQIMPSLKILSGSNRNQESLAPSVPSQ